MRKGGLGAHKLSQNHGIYDVFAASEKTKIEDKDSEKTKTLYFTMFLACRVPKLAFRKVPKTSLFTVFCTPTEDKTTLRAMFSHSQYPKMKPKQWYLRCFCNSEKGIFGERRKTKSNIRMAKIQKRCILRCFFSLSGAKTSVSKSAQNIVIYNVFCSHQRQNNAIYDVFLLSQPQNRAETSVFTMFLQHPKSQRSQNTAICVTFTTPQMQNAVFYSVFEPPLQKHWYLRCFEKLLA